MIRGYAPSHPKFHIAALNRIEVGLTLKVVLEFFISLMEFILSWEMRTTMPNVSGI